MLAQSLLTAFCIRMAGMRSLLVPPALPEASQGANILCIACPPCKFVSALPYFQSMGYGAEPPMFTIALDLCPFPLTFRP